MSEEIIESQLVKPAVSPRELYFKYVRYLPWGIISISVMLLAAFIKLRYSTPIYSISCRLLVTNQAPYGNNEKFDDIFMMQRSDKLMDEIEVIKSRSIASRVVRSLDLQKQIYNKGKIRSSVIHPKSAPFDFEIMSIADSSAGFSVLVNFLGNEQYRLNESPTRYYFNQIVDIGSAKFRITKSNIGWSSFTSNQFGVSWQPLEKVAATLAGNIGVSRVNDFTNVLAISYQTENVKLGADIVNQYMLEYQQGSLEDKRQIAAQTLQFIDAQLDTVFNNLRGVERNLLNYRERNRVIDPRTQSELFFNELSESSKELVQHGVSLKMIDMLTNHLARKENQYRMVPSMSMPGIDEPVMLTQVTEYNKLLLERETALKNTLPNNPRILNMETAIERLRTDMMQSLANIRRIHELSLDEINMKNRKADKFITSIPSKEKQQLEITRQQNILQELYTYLLQKKLETAIASASTISNIKVVEPALPQGKMVSPNRRALYLIAIVIGIIIPAGIVFLKELLNDKIKSRHEVEQLTSAPILGEIGHAEGERTLVVTRNSRKFLAEQFRIIRSNLQYILPKIEKPVLLVTSSFSGEGKSFISTNLGSVLALSGKKTIILEFDIRKPKIMKGLGLQERKGITNFIVGGIELQDLIHAVPGVENLYVIPCGPVPPNRPKCC